LNVGDRTVSYQTFDPSSYDKRRAIMLWTIAVILVVLWLLGFVSSYTMGGLIHVLLVIAIVVILLQVIQGRR
jgi:fatty acid desaturase